MRHRRVPKARSPALECHPRRSGPTTLTLRSSHPTRGPRQLLQRRRDPQHLPRDLDRARVPMALDLALGPTDRPSLAVDASLWICAIRGASYSSDLTFTKSTCSSGSAQPRPGISADSIVAEIGPDGEFLPRGRLPSVRATTLGVPSTQVSSVRMKSFSSGSTNWAKVPHGIFVGV